MSGPGRYARQQMMKWLGNDTPASSMTTPFAAFSTADPGDNAGSLAEPTSTGGYAAQAITWSSVALPSAGSAAILQNSATVSWTSSAAWSTGATTLPYIAVFNNVSTRTESGNYFGSMAVSVPRAVNAAGVTLESLAGDLQFTFAPA